MTTGNLHVPDALNVRSLHGFSNAHGLEIHSNAFYRADSLHRLTAEGQRALIDAGVTTIIDLRSASEIATAAYTLIDPLASGWCHIPLMALSSDDPGTPAPVPDSLETLYRFFIDDCQPAFRQIFAAIADARPGAVLFHCTAGKDRTGMVAALLLSLVGVDDETIADDYSLSAANITPIVEVMREQFRQAGVLFATFDDLMGSSRETMLETLAYLREHYGDAAGYLRHIGITPEQIDRITARLLPAA
ncbi:MAG: tyrosine-protein phosphatase [Anaerolineae bacterium]